MPKTTEFPGRPTFAEIDLGALAFNYRQVQKRIPKGVGIMGIVKADAYGHGAIPVSKHLERLGVEYLGVAMAEEGAPLREAGIKGPILILGGAYKGDVERIFRYHLTPVIFHREHLKLLAGEAEKRKKPVRVHLKIDTGMGRLGVSLDEWPAFLGEMRRYRRIEAEGVLSHYSMADETSNPYTRKQWEGFQKAVAVAESMGMMFQYKHISSSAGLTAFPSWSGNLVRPGIMLYGYHPSPAFRAQIPLKPVMTLKTQISLLKTLPAGERISYGGTFVTRRKSLIGILPVGYADGYSRRLSNQGEVLVRGRRAPVVGRVCMDYVMIDVTGIPGVSRGDEVVLVGRQGRDEISAMEIGDRIGSVSYEVLCLVGKRVPRVYKQP